MIVDGAVYEGVLRVNTKNLHQLKEGKAKYFAVVMFDGEPDIFILEDEKAIEELERYYKSDWNSTNRVIPYFLAKFEDFGMFVMEGSKKKH